MIKYIKTIALIAAVFIAGCKDNYFADGGGPVNTTGQLGVTTMQYLQDNPASFDTLARLIKLTGLEGTVNQKGNTFFAPRDYSINNYFKLLYPDPANRPATLDALPQDTKDEIAHILKDYIIPNQEILRDNLATTYSYATTGGGKKARFNLVTTDYLGNVNMGAKFVNFSLNTSATAAEQYKTVQIATADLRSTNGIVHVLASESHIFGFN
ncbi:fasciclin domain-containing protein [Pedobacter sp. JY14-1]|uniref:fasciclin domain-containing protein n=1 Tax=Pedobacter sp. JY14-1 TaxID=3034151 RepID=UPI0023E0ED6F|nr:fasciclin domain-containing protein [Pedobacter sp. JY14-1]